MYAVVKGIPRPENLTKGSGDTKYPFDGMEVDDSFVVPYTDMKDDENAEQFKSRVYKSAASYARREFKTPEGTQRGAKKDFIAAVMTEDDKTDAKAYTAGDVVVWRTA